MVLGFEDKGYRLITEIVWKATPFKTDMWIQYA